VEARAIKLFGVDIAGGGHGESSSDNTCKWLACLSICPS
jgi:hypothetical protein